MKSIVKGEQSEEVTVDTQVSHKGPFLDNYSFFITKIYYRSPDAMKSSVRLFPDDCIHFRSIKIATYHEILKKTSTTYKNE